MGQSLNSENTNINTYSVNEIISIFSQIDNKIASLHTCSSEDFLSLHSNFKNYFKQSKNISENATQIFDIIAGDKNNTYYNELNSFHKKLNIHLDYSVKQINNSINTLEIILTNLELMFIPFKNFKQNLMTLKYLGTSYKINLDNLSGSDSKELEKDRLNLEELILNVTSAYPLIDDNLRQLKGNVKYSLYKLQKIKERNILNIETILNQIHSSINLLSSKNEESFALIPKLTQKTDNCSISIGKIIENLQFQDIIRQKMEHIQQTQKHIVEELSDLIKSHKAEISLSEKEDYLVKIRDIAGLQAAILIHTNNEYQSAIEIITKKFIEIGQDVADISEICLKFSGLTQHSGETYLNEIENKLTNAITHITNCIKANVEFSFEVDTIHIDIERIAANFENILNIETKLIDLSNKFTNETGKNDLIGVKQLITTLVNDLELIKRNVQQLFDQTLSLSLGLISINEDSSPSNFNQNSEKLSENIVSILNVLRDNNKIVNSYIEQNTEISETILNDIDESVHKVKYYDFFEKIIEEIIIELNSIYYKLKTNDESDHDKEHSLKDIEHLYTVHSERVIHNHMSGITDNNVDIFKEVDKIQIENNEDDSLELF